MTLRLKIKANLLIILILLFAFLFKISLLIANVLPFNGDEAIVALMGRHILAGERPVFFYGQAYMGSLDAYLIAAGFWLFGQQVWVIRFVQILLYLGTIYITYKIGIVALNSKPAGLIAALFLAAPPVNVTLYTTISLGGYGEALFLGSLGLFLGFRLLQMVEERFGENGSLPFLFTGILGLVWGMSVWVNKLAIILVLPVGFLLIFKIIKCPLKRIFFFAITFASGLITGACPWWLHAIQNGWMVLLGELPARSSNPDLIQWLYQSALHFVYLIFFGISVILGLRPPWEISWLIFPLLPFVLIFWIWVVVTFLTQPPQPLQEPDFKRSIAGILVTLFLLFVFLPFGADPTGRYFLPLCIPLSLIAAQRILASKDFLKKFWWVPIAFITAYNVGGTVQCALNNPPGLTSYTDMATRIDHRYDQALIQFLEENGELRGYSNYWIAYPLNFLSHEKLIFIPSLPYHLNLSYTTKDNRYLPYSALVKDSPRVAYITARHPQLDQLLRKNFSELGITWKEKKIGDFQIYYQLSKPVTPEEIGLGTDT